MKYSKDSWQLFHEMFKDGEDIVVVDEYDHFYWGKIRLHKTNPDLGFYLKRTNGKEKCFRWLDIRFMAQDGFPIRKLKGADGSESILDEKPALISTVTESYFTRTVFSDPFMIDDCYFDHFNPGKSGMEHYLQDEEECLALYAKDGACAQLYNFESIYYFN